jgi:hypothetical protein
MMRGHEWENDDRWLAVGCSDCTPEDNSSGSVQVHLRFWIGLLAEFVDAAMEIPDHAVRLQVMRRVYFVMKIKISSARSSGLSHTQRS